MFNDKRLLLVCLTALASILLTACGGGGGNQTSGIDGSGAPMATNTQTTGAINGFGSIIVNGVRYNSDKAKILVSDQQTNEDNLHTGYQVTLTGQVNSDGSAVADTVNFHPNAVGAISHIDLSTQQFTVLNQIIQVTNSTLFDVAISPNYLEGLKVGDQVLVSGKLNDKGKVTATRVELSNASLQQAMGVINNLNETNHSFTLNGLAVNYASATLTNLDNTALSNGQMVVITGTLNNEGTLVASNITRIAKTLGKDIKSAVQEGFITRFSSSTDFDVSGTPCTTSTTTAYDNGNQTDLAVGVSVEVKGTVNSSGVLVANNVQFDDHDTNEIAGQVASLTAPTNTTITTGTLQINGISVQTNAKTAYEDAGSSRVKRFNYSSIQVGNFLKVSGYMSGNLLIATKIEREDVSSDSETELKYDGVISAIDVHSFVVLGNTVITSNQTEFKNAKGDNITEVQFYLEALGKRVQVKGILKNGIYNASEVEIVNSKG